MLFICCTVCTLYPSVEIWNSTTTYHITRTPNRLTCQLAISAKQSVQYLIRFYSEVQKAVQYQLTFLNCSKVFRNK